MSVVLGLTLKELHRCLSLALNDSSVLVLTQVLKCFAALVQATPYHKLEAGLISKAVRNVKTYIYHKGDFFFFYFVNNQKLYSLVDSLVNVFFTNTAAFKKKTKTCLQ